MPRGWPLLVRSFVLLGLGAALAGCFVFSRNPAPTVPEDEARHRAALTNLIVLNRTTSSLTILFRAATPPLQEVTLGTVRPGFRQAVAPIPAGEPISLIARTADGAEFTIEARSYPLDADFTWEIPASTVFRKAFTRG